MQWARHDRCLGTQSIIQSITRQDTQVPKLPTRMFTVHGKLVWLKVANNKNSKFEGRENIVQQLDGTPITTNLRKRGETKMLRLAHSSTAMIMLRNKPRTWQPTAFHQPTSNRPISGKHLCATGRLFIDNLLECILLEC